MERLDILPDALTTLTRSMSTRRKVLVAPVLAALPLMPSNTAAPASTIDLSETEVTLSDAINWSCWSGLLLGASSKASHKIDSLSRV
jgi:hypothetical protein